MADHLLVLGCSATKRDTLVPLPAIDLYDGPIWRSLRTRLAELPRAVAARAEGRLVILALSAQHGFIPADDEIYSYDRRMDRRRADWLSSDALDQFAAGRDLVRREANLASEILVVGGEVYRHCLARTLARGVDGVLDLGRCKALDGKTTWTQGRIGQHRQQLSAWLNARYANVREAGRLIAEAEPA